MNIKALAITIGITTTIAAVLALLIAAMIYFPITTFYVMATLLSIGMFAVITYTIYQFLTNEFDIL
jgi:type III secretory pathway component EscV